MFTHTLATQVRCGDAFWRLRALPEIKGGVSVQTADVRGGVRTAAAADFTFPGTRAWSPPT